MAKNVIINNRGVPSVRNLRVDNAEAAITFRWKVAVPKIQNLKWSTFDILQNLWEALAKEFKLIKAARLHQQLYQKRNILTSISQDSRSLPRNTYYSKEHLSVSASDDIRTIKIYVLYRESNFCIWVIYFHKI